MASRAHKKSSDRNTTRGNVVARLHRAWGESPFYQAQLKGPAPDRFYHMPTDPRTPSNEVADMVMMGKLSIGAHTIDCEGELNKLWDLAPPSGALHAFLQDFSWLRHITAAGDAAKDPARLLVKGWLDRYEKWSPEAWEPYVTAERLTQLCCNGAVVLRGSDALWRSRVLTSMARQTRHLERSSHRANTGYERLMTAMGLTIAGLCLPGCDTPAERGLEMMRRELRLQIRPDGGHVSRNPSNQLSIVLRLQMVLKALDARRLTPPGFLKHVSARASSFLQLFRCGDGKLAIFNGSYEDDGRALVSALQSVDADTPTGFARHSGFQRLDAGRMSLIADTGALNRATKNGEHNLAAPFASLGSFHLSTGRSRLVVNCGNGAHLSADWVRAMRLADAHSRYSTTSKKDTFAASAGRVISHRRGEDTRGQLLEIDCIVDKDTSEEKRHMRRLFASARGDELIGQDRFIGVPAEFLDGLMIRFHLHPDVKSSLARDGKSIILAAPNGEGWRFRSNCQDLSLEKSIYCGAGGVPVSTEQIVLASNGLERSSHEDMVVKWGFRRVET